MSYGDLPYSLGYFSDVHLPEMMFYLYLPVCMGDFEDVRIPEALKCIEPIVDVAMREHLQGQYVYVTAKRLFCTPGNPGNRPGWHCDGFGTDGDLNFIWSNKLPTRFAFQKFHDISDDHNLSMEQFEAQIDLGNVFSAAPFQLLRLNNEVVHSSPEIPDPGCERQFVKISMSPEKYNLEGNAHNYLFDYSWKMYDREKVRNDPIYSGQDWYPTEEER